MKARGSTWWAGLSLWCLWVLASALGGAVAGAGAQVPYYGPLLAASLATAQWLVLRGRIRRAWLWIPLTVAAELIAIVPLLGLVALIIGSATDGSPLMWLGWGLGPAVTGALIGMVQQITLRNGVRRTPWWVLASAVAVQGGTYTYMVLDAPPQGSGAAALLHQVSKMSAVGGVYGALSGVVLARLLRTGSQCGAEASGPAS